MMKLTLGIILWIIFISTHFNASSWATSEVNLMEPCKELTTCTGSADITLTDSAYSVPSPDFTNSTTAQYNVRSRIMCAMRANIKKALGYAYKDSSCTVFGLGEGPDSQSITYCAAVFPPIDSLEEVALKKETYASPHHKSYFKEFAVDGDLSSLYHSALTVRPWLLVDLGETRTIHQVRVLPRQHSCCFDRFSDIEIRVGNTIKTDGNFSAYAWISYYPGPYSEDQDRLICSRYKGVVGRYVSIQRVIGVGTLEMLDVKIFAIKQITEI